MQIKDYLYQKKLHEPLAEAKPTCMKAEDWALLDRQALGAARLLLAKSVAYNVVNEKTTHGLLKALSNMYEKPNYVNEFNSILSRLMSVDIKFDDEVQALLLLSSLPESWSSTITVVSSSTESTKLKFDNIHDLILGEDICRKTSGEYSNSLLSAEDKGRGRKQDRGQKQNRSRSKSKKRGQSKNRQDITCWNCNQKCFKPVTSRDKEVNMAARDYDDALVCCVENMIDDRIMDFGASFHATYCKEELERFKLHSSKVRLADDKTLDIAGVGDVVLKTSFSTSWTLKDVRYIPGLKKRLISGRGNATLWNQRLGHMSEKGIKILASKGRILNLQKTTVGFCEPYVLGKQKKADPATMLPLSMTAAGSYGVPNSRREWQGKEASLAHLRAMAQMRCDIAFGIQRFIRSSEAEMSHLTRTFYMEIRLQQILKSLKAQVKAQMRVRGPKIVSFEDSGRSDKEDSKDRASSKEGGSETPQLQRSTRESRAPVRVKEEQDGKKRYKARLGVKGFQHKHRVDYNKIFSPVVKMTTIRLVLSIVATENLYLEQLDVNTAFLHGDLDEDIYMTHPEGFQSARKEENLVCKLKKSMYGLKQAPRQWYLKFESFMQRTGYKRCAMDHCCYWKKVGSSSIILLLYVDDMLVAGSNMAEIKKLKR
ncbi:retrovirus-related pol polyprotein from transposon TNT 1-94 [Tanacetum coccineum]